MTKMQEIHDQAHSFSRTRAALGVVVEKMKEAISAVERDHMEDLRAAIDEAAKAHEILRAAIAAAPDLFVRPRTVTLHGVKFGMEKGKGSIEFVDEGKTVKLIRQHFPQSAAALIETREKPNKAAIAKLTNADLRKIGDRSSERPIAEVSGAGTASAGLPGYTSGGKD